jgi:hypothetical protein
MIIIINYGIILVMRGSQYPPPIRGDFSLYLLAQIEMLRGDISHEELSKRLGDVTERYLARYVAGKGSFAGTRFLSTRPSD